MGLVPFSKALVPERLVPRRCVLSLESPHDRPSLHPILMSTHRVLATLAGALALALSSPALAQTPAKIDFVRDTLDNGL